MLISTAPDSKLVRAIGRWSLTALMVMGRGELIAIAGTMAVALLNWIWTRRLAT